MQEDRFRANTVQPSTSGCRSFQKDLQGFQDFCRHEHFEEFATDQRRFRIADGTDAVQTAGRIASEVPRREF